jgi:exosome complex RNA-binding protein Rrp4
VLVKVPDLSLRVLMGIRKIGRENNLARALSAKKAGILRPGLAMKVGDVSVHRMIGVVEPMIEEGGNKRSSRKEIVN